MTYSRKLQVQPSYNDMSFQPINTLHSNMSLSPLPQPALSLPYSHTPFESSSMALTVLVLLTALFFMGFFSIYIRRFSSEPAPEFTSNRHSQPTSYDQRPSRTVATSRKGLDPEVIRSLPVYSYDSGEAKYQIDCAVCLGEFDENEAIKVIPYCKHMFHLECIDTWLKMHVTCPLCRGGHFFEMKSKGGGGGGHGGGGGGMVIKDRTDEGGDSSQQDDGISTV